MPTYHQKLPRAGAEREALRGKGQFWTPDWVAEAMVAYAASGRSGRIFDPAVGAGVFFRAAKTVSREVGTSLALSGTEIDPQALAQARENGLLDEDLSQVAITDFVLSPPQIALGAVVCNPPYIRHHRLSKEVKDRLRRLCVDITGMTLDGRAGYHVYFLLRALQLLPENGRLAFIMPADTCEGVFAKKLWSWIGNHYRLDAVVTFSHEASPFPGVDTNAIIFLIKNAKPASEFFWARCLNVHREQLKKWVMSEFHVAGDTLSVCRRDLSEGLSTGLSRPPTATNLTDPVLGEFAKVMRGIATGANEFFFLTKEQANEIGIPAKYLLPAIGRTRNVAGDVFAQSHFKALEEAGKPSLLFSPGGAPPESFPSTVREYLRRGEELGLHRRSLISTRRPWYKMETRLAPPILFAYLGRRNARFIRNLAGVVPLTGFLCVYPRDPSPTFINQLWYILSHPETVKNLSLVGKSYGSGAIKVEPRNLEKLRLPLQLVLQSSIPYQKAAAIITPTTEVFQPRLLGT